MDRLLKGIEIMKEVFTGNIKGMENKSVDATLLNAYNRYQEDERDGTDYIFDLTKVDDIICLIKGGYTLEDLYKKREFRYVTSHYEDGLTPVENPNLMVMETLSENFAVVFLHQFDVKEYAYLLQKYLYEVALSDDYVINRIYE